MPAWPRPPRSELVLSAYRHEPIDMVCSELMQFATIELAARFALPAERAGRRALIRLAAEQALLSRPGWLGPPAERRPAADCQQR